MSLHTFDWLGPRQPDPQLDLDHTLLIPAWIQRNVYVYQTPQPDVVYMRWYRLAPAGAGGLTIWARLPARLLVYGLRDPEGYCEVLQRMPDPYLWVRQVVRDPRGRRPAIRCDWFLVPLARFPADAWPQKEGT